MLKARLLLCYVLKECLTLRADKLARPSGILPVLEMASPDLLAKLISRC